MKTSLSALVGMLAWPAALLPCALRAETETDKRLADAMKSFVRSAEIAGAVAVAADAEETHALAAIGLADIAKDRPLKADNLFWIASMTKPITATAVMMVRDGGLIELDDSIAIYLPEFRNLKDVDGGEVVVTIGQCLTHTSGLADVTLAETRGIATLAELMPFVAAKPVNFTPGGRWQYCQSSFSVAARIVEVVSGESFPDFLEKRLFAPLGMKDTTFYPTPAQLERLAVSYRRTAAGTLEPVGIPVLAGPLHSRKRYPRASGGLFSTAPDYLRFCRMILNGGSLDGHRYLKPESVKLMTTPQTGDLQTGFIPGSAWSYGWCVVREPQGVSAALSPGSFGHGGMFGTQAWIDPACGRIDLLLIQRAGLPNSDGSLLRQALHEFSPEN